MRRVAIILYQDITSWSSCIQIHESLIIKYQERYKGEDTQVFYLSSKAQGNYTIGKELAFFDPELLIFIDHRLIPNFVINELLERGFYKKKRQHIFHVFGHTYQRLHLWAELCEKLEGQDAHFSFCSEKFRDVFRKLAIPEMQESIGFSPICANQKFCFDELQRKELREGLGFKEDELVFLYAGRVSPWKNIDLLLTLVAKFRERNQRVRLIILGNFDDYINIYSEEEGSHRQYITELIEEMNRDEKFIFYFSHQKEIAAFYHGADAFLSFSTMHGDDYGMSICEALYSGLPCLLTDWGGYSSYKNYVSTINYLTISTEEDCFAIDEELALEKMEAMTSQVLSNAERSALAHKNIASIEEFSFKSEMKLSKLSKLTKYAYMLSLTNMGSFEQKSVKQYRELYGDLT